MEVKGFVGGVIGLGLTLGFSCGISAAAQDGLFDVTGKHAESRLDVGVAAVIRDSYTGSNQSSRLVLPFLTAQHKRYFFNPALGAGVFAIKNDRMRLGAAANLALGRDGEDTPFPIDVFDVEPTLTGSVFGRAYLPFAAIDAVGTVPITGDLRGAKLDLLLSTSLSPSTKLRITPGIRATYQTSGWANTNYGITAAQADAVSGLAALDIDSQFAALGVHAAAYLTLSEDYEILSIVNHSILRGDIKNSPLTPKNAGTTFAAGIVRKF